MIQKQKNIDILIKKVLYFFTILTQEQGRRLLIYPFLVLILLISFYLCQKILSLNGMILWLMEILVNLLMPVKWKKFDLEFWQQFIKRVIFLYKKIYFLMTY